MRTRWSWKPLPALDGLWFSFMANSGLVPHIHSLIVMPKQCSWRVGGSDPCQQIALRPLNSDSPYPRTAPYLFAWLWICTCTPTVSCTPHFHHSLAFSFLRYVYKPTSSRAVREWTSAVTQPPNQHTYPWPSNLISPGIYDRFDTHQVPDSPFPASPALLPSRNPAINVGQWGRPPQLDNPLSALVWRKGTELEREHVWEKA